MNNISPKDAQKMIDGGVVFVVDVRTPSEFVSGHIHNAQNININDSSFAEKLLALNKDVKYIVNCQMGGRSARAVSLMNELGFKNAMNLEGGINAWERAGLLVERVKEL